VIQRIRSVRKRVEDRGASAVEYGLMVAAIAALIVGVVFGLGRMLNSNFTSTCDTIATNTSPSQDGCTDGGGDGDGDGGGTTP
jgi:pilus assembly protein Flp/PilA